MFITPLTNLMPSLTCAFLLCRTLVPITPTSWAVIKAVSRAPAVTITPHIFPGESSSCFAFFRRLQVWLVLCQERRKKQRGRGLLPRRCWWGAGGDCLLLRRSIIWKVLTPFKVCAFSIYLYIIHTARLKKFGSDYALCKPLLKNTICYVKSKKKDWWQQLWNGICVAINYLD